MSLRNQALYTELVESSWLQNERDICQRLKEAYVNGSQAWTGIERLVQSLDLQPYVEPSPKGPSEQQNEPVRITRVSEAVDMQSRVSIELMRPVLAFSHVRRTSLSKPAETAVSDVHIVTKMTDLEVKDSEPFRDEKLHRKFRGFRAFLPFQRQKPHPKKSRKNAPDTCKTGPKKAVLNKKGAATTAYPQLTTANALAHAAVSTKTNCRASLVDKHLPLYIRKQILGTKDATLGRLSETEEAVLALVSASNTLHLRMGLDQSGNTAARTDDDRIENLLANSLSLYYRAGSSLHAVDRSSVSDTDKEYILPGLLVRSTEVYDHNMVYEQLVGCTDDEDDEDAYLFR